MSTHQDTLLTRQFPKGVLSIAGADLIIKDRAVLSRTARDIDRRNNLLIGFQILISRHLSRAETKGTYAKMGPMELTRLMALQACDGRTLDMAVKTLVKKSAGDRDACLDAVGNMLRSGLIDMACQTGDRQTKVFLTAAGREEVFKEMTRTTRKTAYNALDEIDEEQS